MNFVPEMIPGICAMFVGAGLAFFADKVCHREKNVPQMRMIGAGLCIIGAILVFLP